MSESKVHLSYPKSVLLSGMPMGNCQVARAIASASLFLKSLRIVCIMILLITIRRAFS